VGKRIVAFAVDLFGLHAGPASGWSAVVPACCSAASPDPRSPTRGHRSLIIPMMIQRGYPPAFAAALSRLPDAGAADAAFHPFLVYAFITGCRCAAVHVRVIPAIISALALIGVCILVRQEDRLRQGAKPATAGESWRPSRRLAGAVDAIMIIGGITDRLFTPTERPPSPSCTGSSSRSSCTRTSNGGPCRRSC